MIENLNDRAPGKREPEKTKGRKHRAEKDIDAGKT